MLAARGTKLRRFVRRDKTRRALADAWVRAVDPVEAEVACWAGTLAAGLRVSGVVRRTGLPKREVFRRLMRLVARRVLVLRWQLWCPGCSSCLWEGTKFPEEVACLYCGWEGPPEPGMWQPVFYYPSKTG